LIATIVPYDFALDREMWRWAPTEVSLLVTRTGRLPVLETLEMAEQISTEEVLRSRTLDLLDVEPDVVLYLCTSGSFVRGVAGERRMREVMRETGAPRAVTTSGALLTALDHLGVRSVSLATPYLPIMNTRLESYLAEAGIRVVASGGLGLVQHIWRVPPASVYDLVLTIDHPDAEAVFISCTNLQTYDLIAPLEKELGKPVLTANQVSIWAALRMGGLPMPDIDQRLFRGN